MTVIENLRSKSMKKSDQQPEMDKFGRTKLNIVTPFVENICSKFN